MLGFKLASGGFGETTCCLGADSKGFAATSGGLGAGSGCLGGVAGGGLSA